MALDATNEIINSSSGIVVQGTAVAGGYFVTSSIAAIPSHAKITGQLCYNTGDSQFYQYDGTNWTPAAFGTGIDETKLAFLQTLSECIEIS